METGTIIKCRTTEEKESLIDLALSVGFPVYGETADKKNYVTWPNLIYSDTDGGCLADNYGIGEHDTVINAKEATKYILSVTGQNTDKEFNEVDLIGVLEKKVACFKLEIDELQSALFTAEGRLSELKEKHWVKYVEADIYKKYGVTSDNLKEIMEKYYKKED